MVVWDGPCPSQATPDGRRQCCSTYPSFAGDLPATATTGNSSLGVGGLGATYREHQNLLQPLRYADYEVALCGGPLANETGQLTGAGPSERNPPTRDTWVRTFCTQRQ